MPANAVADLQFDFFLTESGSDSLWVAPEVRTFSVDGADALSPRSVDAESLELSFDVEYSETDLWRAPTTDRVPTPRHYTEQSERTLASRDEHLSLRSAAEYNSLSSDDHWGNDEARDAYDPQVNSPTDLQQADYHIADYQHGRHGDHQSSTWSETGGMWSSPSSSLSTDGTTEASTAPSGRGRARQVDPPLAMHFVDYVRQVSKMSGRITTSTTTTLTSVRRSTDGGSRLGVTGPSSRRPALKHGGRRASTTNSSSECGRQRCPRFRPGVRRQFCQAQFGECRTNGRIPGKFQQSTDSFAPEEIHFLLLHLVLLSTRHSLSLIHI